MMKVIMQLDRRIYWKTFLKEVYFFIFYIFPMKKIAVIVAGGVGLRMGTAIPKQFLLLQNKPILWHSISSFTKAFNDIEIVVVLPELYLKEGKVIADSFKSTHNIICIAGGNTRFDSVKNGLAYVTENSIVFVHDAVRCLLTTSLIKQCYQQAIDKGSAIPAVMATDSIRIVEESDSKILDRTNIRLVQTPQTFRSDIILDAFTQPYQESFTDEASVVEIMGKQVYLTEGDYNNIKITRPFDLFIAEKILEERLSGI